MIVTQLMWSSLDLCSKYNARFWQHPFEWDPSRQKFVANSKSKKLIFYLLSMVTVGSVPVALLVLLSFHSFGLSNPTFLEILVNVHILLLVMLALVTEWSFATYADELQLCSNYLIRLEGDVQSCKLICGIAELYSIIESF